MKVKLKRGEEFQEISGQIVIETSKGDVFRISECPFTKGITINKTSEEDSSISVKPLVSNNITVV